MEIRQLRAFVAIAESGTFTAGAVRVHVTQAAVSMQIRQLETEVGAKLFIRAPRNVILTEAGEKLLERARHILLEHDAALEEIAELAGAKRGRLRIGSASAGVTADLLPRILKEVRKRYPNADISVTIGHQRFPGPTNSRRRNRYCLCFPARRGPRHSHRAAE